MGPLDIAMGAASLPAQTSQPSFMSRLGGLLNPNPDLSQYAGLLSPEAIAGLQKQQKQQQGLAMAASLLQAGGTSLRPINFGEALGNSLMARSQAGQTAMQGNLPLAMAQQQAAQRKQTEGAAAEKQKALQAALQGGDWAGAAAIDPQATNAFRQATMPPDPAKPQMVTRADGSVTWVTPGQNLGAMGKPEDPPKPQAFPTPDGGVRWALPGQDLPGAAGGSKPTDQQRNAVTQFQAVGNVLDNYANTLTRLGPTIMPGTDKTELQTAYRGLQLEMKNLAQLGALSATDLEILDQMIVDPTSSKAQYLGQEGLDKNVSALRDYLAQKKKAYTFGGAPEGEPVADPLGIR